MIFFQQHARSVSPRGFGKLRSITVRFVVANCSGSVYFTDVMLQAGSVATGWAGHVCEIKWTMDG